MAPYVKSLDGLRAVAVGIVMLAHAGSPFPRSGGIGVDIFFVLSGFLITGILSREYQTQGVIRRRNFYARRFLRLSPALFICVGLFAVLSLISSQRVPSDVVIISLTYTANYARALFDWDLQSMEHCWSLAIEEQYYLLWPLVIIGLERLTSSCRQKAALLTGVAILLGIYRYAMVGTFSADRIYFALDTHMDGLVLGSALTYFVKDIQNRGALSTAWQRFLSLIVVPLVITGGLLLMAKLTWDDPNMGRFGFSLAALGSALLILDLTVSSHSLIRVVLENRMLTYCGRISYGLYLFHLPIYAFTREEFHSASLLTRVPSMILVSFLFASLSYHFVEKRFLRLKQNFTAS